jgi:Kef-type K+ transport system membrane component KefB
LIVALAAAFITHRLGAYYLVGAFVAGMIAQRFRHELPSMASEKMLHAVEVFASFFIPFYFFKAGLHVKVGELELRTILIALFLIVVIIPLKIVYVAIHRRIVIQESYRDAVRIGIAISPTLVFSLVIADILKERFAVPVFVYGAIWIYALINTLIPGIVLKIPPPDFESPHLPEESPRE